MFAAVESTDGTVELTENLVYCFSSYSKFVCTCIHFSSRFEFRKNRVIVSLHIAANGVRRFELINTINNCLSTRLSD